MMSYLHTKFHDKWIRSCDDKILGRTDGRTDGRSDCTSRPAFAFGDAGKKQSLTVNENVKSPNDFTTLAYMKPLTL